MDKKVRVATVKETGKRYIVSFISFSDREACLLGEVMRQEGQKTWHEASFYLPLDAVVIEEIQKNQILAVQLFDQSMEWFNVDAISGRKNQIYHISRK